MPYLHLSGFYFFYFALLGALVPYWSLYLHDHDLGAEMIGLLMATLHLSRILAPNLWGWIADRTGQRLRIVRLGALLTWLIFIAIFWQTSALGLGLVMLAFSFFWNAVLPQCEVITLQHLGRRREEYSRIRLWGSVGFIVAVVGVGLVLDWLPIHYLPWLVLVLMLAIWLNTLFIPAAPVSAPPHNSRQAGIWEIVRTPQVLAFFIIFFLVQLSHGPYYTFFSVMMAELGFSRSQIGLLWAMGVVAEVVLFIGMPFLLRRYSLRQLMLWSLVLCSLRWLLTGLYADQLVIMLLAQLLHAASFGSLHAVGIALVHHYFNPQTQGRGQALFSSAGFGAGGAAGAALSGLLWSSWGGAATFFAAALVGVLAWCLALIWIHPEKVPQLDE